MCLLFCFYNCIHLLIDTLELGSSRKKFGGKSYFSAKIVIAIIIININIIKSSRFAVLVRAAQLGLNFFDYISLQISNNNNNFTS